MPPGIWHNEMEAAFPETLREVKFFCSSSGGNTCRRADILLSHSKTVEIQHSYISSNEIVARFNDWNKFGKEIIWLVDGNSGVMYSKLSTGNYLLKINDTWKYESFRSKYKFILLEWDDKIFKIELNKIKCKMIELKEYKSKEEVINELINNPDNIWNLWSDDNTVKSSLIVFQQGAGNGKTYGIWKSISENEDKKTYIILTKQHSAKNVIKEELDDQATRNEYHIQNMEDRVETFNKKQYVIKYTHKISKRECIVIIGTIDSFCFNLSSSSKNNDDFFQGILNNINENGINKVSKYGFMYYGGTELFLNKECDIWIDETQDLPPDYLFAMTKVMLETNCNINIVGDKLQSLEYKNNFITNLKEGITLPNIEVKINKPINNNRRIQVKNMHTEINELVDFKKYGLPEIECDEDKLLDMEEESIEIIDSPIIYANDQDDKKVNQYVNTIIAYVDEQVKKYNYKPNDFMFIFPVMKCNVIASELQTKLQEYWINEENDENYKQYVFLHKHTEGKCIETKDSVNASRIMSIRTSKGDGRNVVFILGITERSLKLVSKQELDLTYDSHLHVALTRAKKKIYFGLVKNNDDIHTKFAKEGYVEYLPILTKKISLEKIIDNIDKNDVIELLLSNGIKDETYLNKENNKCKAPKEMVDWGYHCIKYYTYYFRVILNIVSKKDSNTNYDGSELQVILSKISQLGIKIMKPKEFYEYLDEHQYKIDNNKKMYCLPLCDLSDKPNYKKYCNYIKSTMIIIQKRIRTNKLDTLTVYESIILSYMIQIYRCQKYADITPMDIYDITYYFEIDNNKEKNLLENIHNVNTIIEKALSQCSSNIKWNILKHIRYKGENEDFVISKLQFPIIGNGDSEITHIMLKSDISELNYWDIMIEILLERFIIYNPESEKDIAKFKDKKIITYVFILNKNDFIKIDWEWDKDLNTEIKKLIKSTMKGYYKDYYKDIFQYLKYVKENIEPNNLSDYIYNVMTKENNVKYPSFITRVIENMEEMYETEESFIEDLEAKFDKFIGRYLGI